MNQQQRKFLIDKIEDQTNTRIRLLRDSLPEFPSLTNYLFHQIMTGSFDIKDKEELKAQITNRCINSKEGKTWTGEDDRWSAEKNKISFKLRDFFIIPTDYEKVYDKYVEEKEKIEKEMSLIQGQCDTLVMRIQLASNSTLDTLIKEVDDMGNLKLMDTKLKALKS